MINYEEITKNIKSIYDGNSSLDTLLEFERILDDLHVYAYKNWFEGEVIQGPEVNRYWIKVTLMYPYDLMPDPDAAKRLTNRGCVVKYAIKKYKMRVPIETPDDLEMDSKSGKRKPKKEIVKVWFVDIEIPRHLIDEYNTNKLEVNGVEVNMGDVTDASDNDLDTVKPVSGDTNDKNM